MARSHVDVSLDHSPIFLSSRFGAPGPSRRLTGFGVCCFLVTLLLTIPAFAQIPNVGNTTSTPAAGDHDYLGSLVETVNPANGASSIRINTRIPQGRQLTLPFSFTYDTNGAFYIGQPSNGKGGPGYHSIPQTINSLGGWSFSYPVMSLAVGSWTIPNFNDGTYTCHGSTNYVFQDANGDRHNLALSVSPNKVGGDGENCSDGLTGDGEVTTGGEGSILATTSVPQWGSGIISGVTIADANGTIYNIPTGDYSSQQTLLATSVIDRNGNAITITNSNPSVSYNDTLGRTVLSTTGMGGNPDTVTIGGLGASYEVYWTPTSGTFTDNMLNLPGGNESCPTSMYGTSNVISSIVLPNTRSFTFWYDNKNGDDPYGMLREIDYPSGGHVRYVWGLNSQAEAGSWVYSDQYNNYIWSCRYDFPAITDRWVSFDGSTEPLHQHFEYSTTWPNGNSGGWTTKTTTVITTDIKANTSFATVYTYTPLQIAYVPNCVSCNDTSQVPVEQTIKYYNDAQQQSLLKTVTKSWKNVRLLQSEQTTLDNGQSTLTVYCYDSNEELIEKDEYGLGTGTPSPAPCANVPSGTQAGQLLRKSKTTYAAFSTHIVDLPASLITYDGSSNPFAETDSWYDQSGNPNRGNLTTQTKRCFSLANGQACPQGDSTTTYTYDGNGQPLTMVDANGNASGGTPSQHTTTFSYADSYTSCGGAAPPSSPSDAYLTQVTFPSTNGVIHQVSYCYDYTKGVLLAETAQNGQTANYQYNDSLDRLTKAIYPDGGQTTIGYNDAIPSVTQTKLISASVSMSSTNILDGMGHVTQSQITTDPETPDYVDTVYGGSGQVFSRSNPHRSGALPTDGTTTYSYDGLGRTTQVLEPDNSVIAMAYSGNCTTVTDEALNQRKSCVDGLGRMTGVWEAPNQIGYNFETDYSYDALGNLNSVNQIGNPSLGGARVRGFQYDSLSHLTQSANPETGTLNYSYDPNGNVTSRVAPAPNCLSNRQNCPNGQSTVTTSYGYDALNRLTGKTYSALGIPVVYNYDGTTSGCPPGVSDSFPVGTRTSMCDGSGVTSWAQTRWEELQRKFKPRRPAAVPASRKATIQRTSTIWMDLLIRFIIQATTL